MHNNSCKCSIKSNDELSSMFDRLCTELKTVADKHAAYIDERVLEEINNTNANQELKPKNSASNASKNE